MKQNVLEWSAEFSTNSLRHNYSSLTRIRLLGGEESEILGQGNSNALQHSRLENPMDRGPWWAMVHGVTSSAGHN